MLIVSMVRNFSPEFHWQFYYSVKRSFVDRSRKQEVTCLWIKPSSWNHRIPLLSFMKMFQSQRALNSSALIISKLLCPVPGPPLPFRLEKNSLWCRVEVWGCAACSLVLWAVTLLVFTSALVFETYLILILTGFLNTFSPTCHPSFLQSCTLITYDKSMISSSGPGGWSLKTSLFLKGGRLLRFSYLPPIT